MNIPKANFVELLTFPRKMGPICEDKGCESGDNPTEIWTDGAERYICPCQCHREKRHNAK